MNNSSIQAIVMDLGGVILRTEDPTSRQKLEEKYNLSINELNKLVFHSEQATASTIGLCSQEDIWQNVADTLSLSPKALDEFQRLFFEGDQIDHKLLNFLKESRAGFKTALLSNAWLNVRRDLSEKFGVIEGQTVDYFLISSELGVAKPDPRIYQILANTINCDYDEILFVDDFIENINAAKTLGIHTIHYRPGMNLINEIKSRLGKNK